LAQDSVERNAENARKGRDTPGYDHRREMCDGARYLVIEDNTDDSTPTAGTKR
jgi:hypothetical protein